MPFDEDEKPSVQSLKSQKVGLKNVSSQPSIFDSMPKKPSPEEFEKKVNTIQEKSNSYKARASEIANQFIQSMNDKTLKQNKSPFAKEIEREILSKMITLASEINNDEFEQAGMGSLSLITLLIKTCFSQRDRLNHLEFTVAQLEKKLEPGMLTGLISKEIKNALDKNSG